MRIKKKLIYIVLLILVFFTLFFVYFFKNIGTNNNFLIKVSSYVPSALKETLRDTIFVFRKNQLLEEQIEIQKSKNKRMKENIKQLVFESHDKAIKLGYIPINKLENDMEFEINGQNYLLKKFRTFLINTSKYPKSKSNSYLDIYKDELILVSAHGIFSHSKIENFENKIEKLDVISSNIKDLVEYKDFYLHTEFGIKDILVINDKIYVSYVNRKIINGNNCYNTSIMVAEINFDRLDFEIFFDTNECLDEENLGAHNSGGRMVKYNDQMILTIGEYNYMNKAQEKNSIFGKVIVLDLDKKNFYSQLAMGVRNSQGLYYSDKKNIVFLTDHGPQGGDEINFIDLNIDINKEIRNFGWPVASYGEHYGGKDAIFNEPLYETAPLYKSHTKYGFLEPIKYFTPSLGISQVLELDPKFLNSTYETDLLISALGQDINEGDMSLHLINLDNNFIYKKSEQIILNERIRDMIYYNKENKIILFLETTGSIGILSKKID